MNPVRSGFKDKGFRKFEFVAKTKFFYDKSVLPKTKIILFLNTVSFILSVWYNPLISPLIPN